MAHSSQVGISVGAYDLLDSLEGTKQQTETLIMGIKQNLVVLLKQKGMTLPQLAKASGVPKSTIHSWENQRAINIDQLRSVAQVLEVSVHQLLYGEADPFETISNEVLTEIFRGDVRITLHKIVKKK